MDLPGNEKKIQTLFRELKLADERVAPGFTGVWNRAQATSPGSWRMFKISFAMATAIVVITLFSVVLWSRNWQRSQQPERKVADLSVNPGSTPTPTAVTLGPKQVGVAESHNRFKSRRWDRKLAARRQANLNARNTAIQEAVSVSTWQS